MREINNFSAEIDELVKNWNWEDPHPLNVLLDFVHHFSDHEEHKAISLRKSHKTLTEDKRKQILSPDDYSVKMQNISFKMLELRDSIVEDQLEGKAENKRDLGDPSSLLRFLEEDRQELFKLIEADNKPFTDKLFEFANQYAINRNLAYEAHFLCSVVSNTDRPADQQSIKDRIFKLVDEIYTSRIVSKQSPTITDSKDPEAKIIQPVTPLILSCEKLNFEYKRTGFALSDISFELRHGEILGLLGKNGNGKTTLMRCIIGELKHQSGRLMSHGSDRNSVDQETALSFSDIAYVPQSLPNWSENLEYVLRYEAAINGIRGKQNDKELDFVTTRLDIYDYLDHKWEELSTGTKLRFSLARALISKPKILVLDEPLANLDLNSQSNLMLDLRSISLSATGGFCVILSTQNIHEVEAVADQIILLEGGRATYSGPTDQIGAKEPNKVFEVSCSNHQKKLYELNCESSVRGVKQTGHSTIILTENNYSIVDMFKCSEKYNIQFDYIRDISTSTKRYLLDN